jgi:hypothetical protein
MDNLARSYANHFLGAYAERCAVLEDAMRDWLGSPRAWTDRMLGRSEGILKTAADRWVNEHFGNRPRQFFFERRKVDLMVALGDTDELCSTTPVLLVEHENAHDVEIEAWNLACWRVPLRVLVFYSDETDRAAKFDRMNIVLRRLENIAPIDGEFLLLTAPWNFGNGLTWRAWNWGDSSFEPLEVSTT